jgi:protein-arginine kinase activator protein McsA
LSSAGIQLENEGVETKEEELIETTEEEESIDELEKQLQEAINNEEYERASELRDEIQKRKEN